MNELKTPSKNSGADADNVHDEGKESNNDVTESPRRGRRLVRRRDRSPVTKLDGSSHKAMSQKTRDESQGSSKVVDSRPHGIHH